MSLTDKLEKVIKDMSEDMLLQVIDFAEYLQYKHNTKQRKTDLNGEVNKIIKDGEH